MPRIFLFFLMTSVSGLCSAYSVPKADANGDGTVRIVFLSASGGAPVNMQAVVEQFSEQMRKSSDTPIKATVLPFPTKTLLMCGYSPELKELRDRLFAPGTDWIIACENPEIVQSYPEIAFEGARRIKELATAHGIRTAVLLSTKPSKTYRDDAPFIAAPTLYRIADGLDLPVVPAAVAWWQCAKDNRLDGKETLRDASIVYAYAAAVSVFLRNGGVPETGTCEQLESVEKQLLRSVRTAYRRAASEPWHNNGRWNGVVSRRLLSGPLKIAFPEGQFEQMLASNLVSVATANKIECGIVSPSEANFIFGRFNLLPKYLSGNSISASEPPQIAVFNRPVDNGATAAGEISLMEDYLLKGYDAAKTGGYLYVPLHLALARMYALRPELKINNGIFPEAWVAHMYAAMLFSVRTASSDVLPAAGPEDKRSLCGFGQELALQTLRELSDLRIDLNTLRVHPIEVPGSFAVMLDKPPAKKVTVHLDVADAKMGVLSERKFTFDRGDYNVPRTFSATRKKPGEFRILVATESDDSAADGLVETRIAP